MTELSDQHNYARHLRRGISSGASALNCESCVAEKRDSWQSCGSEPQAQAAARGVNRAEIEWREPLAPTLEPNRSKLESPLCAQCISK